MAVKDFEKSSNIPYYLQIKDILKSRLNGTYPANGLLPSETTLAQEFNVTRTTIRNAIKELQREGLVHTEKGKGTMVSTPKIEQSLLKFYSFGGEYKNTVHQMESEVIEKITVEADEFIAGRLKIPISSGVYKIVRLRSLKEAPIIIETSYIPEKLAPKIIDFELEGKSIYDLLENNYNLKIANAREYIEPRIATKKELDFLGLKAPAAVFYTERTTHNLEYVPMELRISIIRGDKFKFYTELN